jgi:hypothetical protein
MKEGQAYHPLGDPPPYHQIEPCYHRLALERQRSLDQPPAYAVVQQQHCVQRQGSVGPRLAAVPSEEAASGAGEHSAVARTHSLDFLNFEEKRRLIASSLSLSDFLGGKARVGGE